MPRRSLLRARTPALRARFRVSFCLFLPPGMRRKTPMSKRIISDPLSRPQFIYYPALATSAAALAGCAKMPARKTASTDKLRIAAVGGGGKGGSDIHCCSKEEIVAICDADKTMAAG